MLHDLNTHGKINFLNEVPVESDNAITVNIKHNGLGNPFYLCKNTTTAEEVLRKYRLHIFKRMEENNNLKDFLEDLTMQLMHGKDLNFVFSPTKAGEINHSQILHDIVQIIRSREIMKLEGVTHININSNSNTELGKMLSNYSTYTIVHPKYGKIHTIEGLWCFLRSNKRLKWCLECPNGSKLNRSKIVDTWNGTQEQFRDEIKSAIELKIKTYKGIRNELVNSNLPFTMYFINSRQKIRVPPVQWLVEYMEELRLKYKALELVHTSTV